MSAPCYCCALHTSSSQSLRETAILLTDLASLVSSTPSHLRALIHAADPSTVDLREAELLQMSMKLAGRGGMMSEQLQPDDRC